MITITIYKKDDVIYGFSSSGHAEFGNPGHDIICAGVSALILNAINSIELLCTDKFHVRDNQEKGQIQFKFDQTPGEQSQLLMQSMIIGLQGIQKTYSKKYIILHFREV